MSTRLILVGGGARSGKSRFALGYAQRLGERRLFIATAQALDDEMRARIDRHRGERGERFRTVEEPLAPATAITQAGPNEVVLLDCLTLWLSNLLLAEMPNREILRRVEELIAAARSRAAPTVIVSNEVGMGLVPETSLGRRFRDLAGGAHQLIAAASDECYGAMMGMVLRLQPAPVIAFRAGETP
jgi:adenosylcobinamide kinase / adenosylcobinamide-phosphate guanylyltransferase